MVAPLMAELVIQMKYIGAVNQTHEVVLAISNNNFSELSNNLKISLIILNLSFTVNCLNCKMFANLTNQFDYPQQKNINQSAIHFI